MIIRKLFKFENAHIVRGCSTIKCRSSLHGHSYQVELLFESNFLDNGQMVYDFGLMKLSIKEIIDSFDHTITLYSGESSEYIADMKKHSARWIELPVSPSAEQFSRVFFLLIERIIECSEMCNGEKDVRLHSIIVHETQSGYAQCFYEDAHSKLMGNIDLANITFSPQIISEWSQKSLFDDILHQKVIKNPKVV